MDLELVGRQAISHVSHADTCVIYLSTKHYLPTSDISVAYTI
jgi:hypothetical protein